MFNILSNAVSLLTSNIFLFILSSLLTYIVPTEHLILPLKLAVTNQTSGVPNTLLIYIYTYIYIYFYIYIYYIIYIYKYI